MFALSVSPSGNLLATLSISGQLSLWDLPSLRLKQQWVPDQLVRGRVVLLRWCIGLKTYECCVLDIGGHIIKPCESESLFRALEK